jgi:hypothetical protein
MTEQEVRKIVREELHNLLISYKDLKDDTVAMVDITGNTCYGYRKKYSEEGIIKILIEELSLEATNG